jgi:hypothetical protein
MNVPHGETRREPRYQVDWPATVRLSGFSTVRAEVRDVGAHGIGLTLPAGISARSEFWVMLGTALGPVLGRATVKWQVGDDGHTRAGAFFQPHGGYSSVRYRKALGTLGSLPV